MSVRRSVLLLLTLTLALGAALLATLASDLAGAAPWDRGAGSQDQDLTGAAPWDQASGSRGHRPSGDPPWARGGRAPLQNLSGPPGPVMLPVLNNQGDDDVCFSWLAVQNVGDVATKPVLVTWARAGESAGPLKAECGGQIKPGMSWSFLGAQVPSGSRSGFVYSFTNRPLSEVAPGTEVDDLVGEAICERVFYRTVGAERFAEFHAAYLSGDPFEGISMRDAWGAPVTVEALRGCPGSLPGTVVEAGYLGQRLDAELMEDDDGVFRSHVFPVRRTTADGQPFKPVVVQNGGVMSGTLQVSARPAGDAPVPWSACGAAALRPGEAGLVDLEGCTDQGVDYVVKVEAPQPAAAYAETALSGTLTTHTGWPAGWQEDAAGRPAPAPVGRMVAPLAALAAGDDVTIWVFNPGATSLSAEVTWMAGAGQQTEVSSGTVCAGCLEGFGAPVPSIDERGQVVLRTTSVGGTPVAAPAAIRVVERNQAGEALAAYAYNLIPASLLEPQGSGGLAVPLLFRDLDGVGIRTELALSNANATSSMDAAVLVYDVNDLVAVSCVTLPPGAMRYLSGATLGLPEGGQMRAVVRPRGTGRGADLTTAAVQRFGTVQGEDIPGDEEAASAAAPLVQAPAASLYDPETLCAQPFRKASRPDPVSPPQRAAAVNAVHHLPVLFFQGQDDVCAPSITVTNAGGEAAKAMLVTWGEPGFCPPQSAGPLAVACSGLIAPGGDWTFGRLETPTGSKSGVIHALNAKSLRDLGVEPSDELAADRLCNTLFFAGVGSPDDWREFAIAWAKSDTYADLPLGQMVSPDLSVAVERTCPDVDVPGAEVTSSYEAVTGDRFDPLIEAEGRYVQAIAQLYADRDGAVSIVYLQNGGPVCVTVSLSFHTDGDWDAVRQCRVFTLAPGETFQFDASDCVGPEWEGAVVLDSTGPLAVMADTLRPGDQRSGRAWNNANPYDLSGDGVVNAMDMAILVSALGSTPGDPAWVEWADFTLDGLVDDEDRQILLRNMTGLAPTPETPTPGTPTPGTPTPTQTAIPDATVTEGPGTPGPGPVGVIYLPLGETKAR